jgi:DNA repair exonuclease SbcCD ATPase subunit
VNVIPVPKNYEEALVVIEQLLSKIADLEDRLEKAEARAEKAEARAEKAEARVAELEKRLEKYEKKPSPDPNTPSGMIPPYKKPNRKKGRKKKAGRKKGHAGARRKKPDRVDNHAYHPLTCCPDCGSSDVTVHETVTRYTEEIPPV